MNECEERVIGIVPIHSERARTGERRLPAMRCLAVIILAACGGVGEPQGKGNDSSTDAQATDGAADVTEAVQVITAQPCGPSAADELAAEAMAKACGSRVEVESGRTEYTELYVEPSGSRTIVAAIAPQRARRLDGTWGPIDTTLQQVGDLLAPMATAANVRFSTGGTGPFVTLTREDTASRCRGRRRCRSRPYPATAPRTPTSCPTSISW
jgi:hypothetical protein